MDGLNEEQNERLQQKLWKSKKKSMKAGGMQILWGNFFWVLKNSTGEKAARN